MSRTYTERLKAIEVLMARNWFSAAHVRLIEVIQDAEREHEAEDRSCEANFMYPMEPVHGDD